MEDERVALTDLEVAHLNRITMIMGGADGGRGEAAIRTYLARRSGVRELPYLDHLLLGPKPALFELTADEVTA